MSLLHILEVQNTQNKVYNNARRTYLDEADLKEGESFCRKCKGVGEILSRISASGHEVPATCPQCVGRGIVDWVTQAVERPPLMTGSASSSSSSYSGAKGIHGTSGRALPPKPTPPPSRIINEGFSIPKWVTKIKRRKIV